MLFRSLERNYSVLTVNSYRIDLEQFEIYLKGIGRGIDDITVDGDIVRNWIVFLMDEKMTSASVNRKLSSLRSFYRFLLRKGIIESDPTRKVVGPKKKKALPVFLREKEMDRLLDDIPFNEDFEGCKDKMIIEMFYDTGIRRSELIGLNKQRDRKSVV